MNVSVTTHSLAREIFRRLRSADIWLVPLFFLLLLFVSFVMTLTDSRPGISYDDLSDQLENLAALIIVFPAIVLALAFVAGFMWAPVGALLCAFTLPTDQRRGPFENAVLGGVCSALFVVPWIYLMARTTNRKDQEDITLYGYFLLYATWLLALIGYLGTASIIGTIDLLGQWIGAESIRTAQAKTFVTIVFFIATILCLVSWRFSLRSTSRYLDAGKNAYDAGNSGIPDLSCDYFKPWAYTMLWGIVCVILLVIDFSISFTTFV